jgi:cobalt-zinc-cadmium efflux system outer membrane protein
MWIFRRSIGVSVLLCALLTTLPSKPVYAETVNVTEIDLKPFSIETAETASVASEAEPGASGMLQELQSPDASGLLSLDEALERAIVGHPGIASLEKEYRVLSSLAWQAGSKPNPGIEIELGEFGGTEAARGFRSLATSLTYSQPIERGGKRGLREMAARLESELIAWDMAELEHEIQAEVRLAYADAQSAQYALLQLDSYRKLLLHVFETVDARVEAGRSARLELERLEIEMARLELQISAARRSRQQTLLKLAASMGSTAPDFDSVEVVGLQDTAVMSLDELQPQLAELPALARYDAEYEVRSALFELESANAVADLEWFGGITRLNEIQETVFNVGVAWSLPVHDKNEGNINAAYHRREQVELDKAATLLALELELASLHGMALLALENYAEYSASLLPSANQVLLLTEEGYRYGKFELLDVLDAQRTVLELESEQTAALLEFHLQLAQIEALLNTKLNAAEPVAVLPEGEELEQISLAIASQFTEVPVNE